MKIKMKIKALIHKEGKQLPEWIDCNPTWMPHLQTVELVSQQKERYTLLSLIAEAPDGIKYSMMIHRFFSAI